MKRASTLPFGKLLRPSNSRKKRNELIFELKMGSSLLQHVGVSVVWRQLPFTTPQVQLAKFHKSKVEILNP